MLRLHILRRMFGPKVSVFFRKKEDSLPRLSHKLLFGLIRCKFFL